MTFLSPWIIAIAAGATVPPLVLLYFLKLRRQRLPISSTLLWKRAVQDLQVNAPFQRLRNNLLLLLQLLILLLAAIALGKPLMEQAVNYESTLILMIDQSASMAVREDGGETRLEQAKREAKRLIDSMPDDARAMVIAFCDRATVVSSFDADRNDLKRKIDTIDQTQSSSKLSEAIALAEAYSQNVIIGGSEAGADVIPEATAPPATAIILTDGRIDDAGEITVQRLNAEAIQVARIGKRNDNVGIMNLSARRSYERPEVLEVYARVRNFGPQPATFDAVLRLTDDDGKEHTLDTQTVTLQAGYSAESTTADDASNAGATGGAGDSSQATTIGLAPSDRQSSAPGSEAQIAFDELTFEGGGVIEIKLSIDDALAADNVAWVILPPPRAVKVLLVSDGNLFLERALATLPIEVVYMSPAEYEAAASNNESVLADGNRSIYDVVMFDRHATAALYQGGYFFWGAVPQVDGVSMGDMIDNEAIFDWDESHPVLRHVPVETIHVWEWNKLDLPRDAVTLIAGETSAVLSLLNRDGRDYLISAFALLVEDDITGEPVMNTTWVVKAHYPVFLYNAIQFLSSSLATSGSDAVRVGEPVSIPVIEGQRSIVVNRPDRVPHTVPTAGAASVHYARTRNVGVYDVEGAPPEKHLFAVNLFDATESDVMPLDTVHIGANVIQAGEGIETVNRPFWPWLLLAMLAVLGLEWIVYSKRVFV